MKINGDITESTTKRKGETMNYRFKFYRDYYNERGEYLEVVMAGATKDAHSLSKVKVAEYLMVIDITKPVGAHGFKIVKEEGIK
jgi:hypothetical protein